MTDVAEGGDPFAGTQDAAAALENSGLMDTLVGTPDEAESSPPAETTPDPAEAQPAKEKDGPPVVTLDPDLDIYGSILGEAEVEPAPNAEAEGEAVEPAKKPEAEAEESAGEITDDSPVEWTTSNGESFSTTLGEMKRGYLREGDYTQKTQTLAAERQDFETVVGNVRQELESEFALITEITNEISEVYSGRAQKPDEELLHADPDEYQRLKNMYDLQQDRWGAVRQKGQGLLQQKAQQRAQHQEQNVQRQIGLLNSTLPIMTDPVKGPKVREAILSELVHRGFNDAEISATLDHRNIRLAHDAMLWRLSQDGKDATRNKMKNTPRMKKPGGSRDRSEGRKEGKDAAMQRAASSNNMLDHANALLAIVGQ